MKHAKIIKQCKIRINYYNKTIFYAFPAFTEEFVELKRLNSCRANDAKVLKEFTLFNNTLGNHSLGLQICEEYCGMNGNCWGCSYHCNNSCRWNAVEECIPSKDEFNEGSVIQKNGRKNDKIPKLLNRI